MRRVYVRAQSFRSSKGVSEYLSVKGHRKRVRDEIRAVGTLAMSEHHLLEYILFHLIPRKDTKPLSYDLINAYGNLYGVTCAPYGELLKFKDMTENAALFLSVLGEISVRYLQESGDMNDLRDVEEVMGYIRKVINPHEEACYLISLSSTNEMQSVETILEGVDNSLNVPVRSIVRRAMDIYARRVIVIHNHPSGTVGASRQDRQHTYRITAALEAVEIEVVDHVIIYEKEAYSVKGDAFYRHNWRFR